MAKEKVHKVTEQELANLMAKGMNREEAEYWCIDHYPEVVFPDEADNVNEELKEQRKVAHVYDKKKGKRKVERKPDEDKRYLIDLLYKACGDLEGVVLKNVEREIGFTYNGSEYSVVLTKHRKEKNG